MGWRVRTFLCGGMMTNAVALASDGHGRGVVCLRAAEPRLQAAWAFQACARPSLHVNFQVLPAVVLYVFGVVVDLLLFIVRLHLAENLRTAGLVRGHLQRQFVWIGLAVEVAADLE